MPIYEYQCEKCGTFEVTQKITEAALRRCPTCKGKVMKLISSTSFQLKGTGWYVTDYASKGNNAAKTKANGESPPADKSKSEAAPAADGEGKNSSPAKKTEATAA